MYVHSMKVNSNKEIAKKGIENILSQNKNILDIITEEKKSQIVDFDEHIKEVQKEYTVHCIKISNTLM